MKETSGSAPGHRGSESPTGARVLDPKRAGRWPGRVTAGAGGLASERGSADIDLAMALVGLILFFGLVLVAAAVWEFFF